MILHPHKISGSVSAEVLGKPAARVLVMSPLCRCMMSRSSQMLSLSLMNCYTVPAMLLRWLGRASALGSAWLC